MYVCVLKSWKANNSIINWAETLIKHATSGGQSTQIKYLSKSTDTYTKILLQ